MLCPSLCWNDDQHKEPRIDTKIIQMGNKLTLRRRRRGTTLELINALLMEMKILLQEVALIRGRPPLS